MTAIQDFIQGEDGVTAIEYGLIAALVAVAIVAGARAVGISLNDIFQRLADCFTDLNGSSCTTGA